MTKIFIFYPLPLLKAKLSKCLGEWDAAEDQIILLSSCQRVRIQKESGEISVQKEQLPHHVDTPLDVLNVRNINKI